MKLYLTATSERASKGQGGNEFISIDLRNEKAELLLGMVIIPRKEDGVIPINIDMAIDIASDMDFLKVLKNAVSFTIDKKGKR